MQITGTFTKIGWNASLDLLTVHQMSLMIHIQNHPNMTCDCQLFAHRRRQTYCSKLLRFAPNGIFFAFHEHTVEFEGINHPLAGKPNDQAALFCLLDVIRFDQVPQEYLVVILGNPMEVMQPQNSVCKSFRRHFSARSQGRHSLVIQKTVRKPIQSGRFTPPLFQIQLYQRNTL